MTIANMEAVVQERYRRGARERVADLCCPVGYDLTTEAAGRCCGPGGCC
ncbi:MAG TPA: hypothetical protein VMR44_07950 [Thermoanaerobaculia bacterium]|nr:hypothetical protein [Thermoanaerobaculia bacterium]